MTEDNAPAMGSGRYLASFLAIAVALYAAYLAIMIYVPGRPAAEYWLHESIVVKKHISAEIKQPKIIFLGGSSVLFSIDAKQVEDKLHRPALNMGLHGGMRLERILSLGAEVAKPGDLMVLAPERDFYACDQSRWSSWQVRNELAWDRPYFDSLPLGERIWAVSSGSDPTLWFEQLTTAVGTRLAPRLYRKRTAALGPEAAIIERFNNGSGRTPGFEYSAYNLDDRGTMLHTADKQAIDPGATSVDPGPICPGALDVYRQFVKAMTARHVQVVFAYPPYLLDGQPDPAWRAADDTFHKQIASIGSQVIEQRDAAFFPRSAFFNMSSHLNADARVIRTKALIAPLSTVLAGGNPADEPTRLAKE